jgi:hypothetical protein
LKAVVLNIRVQPGHRSGPPNNLAASMRPPGFPQKIFACDLSDRIGYPSICGKLPIGHAETAPFFNPSGNPPLTPPAPLSNPTRTRSNPRRLFDEFPFVEQPPGQVLQPHIPIQKVCTFLGICSRLRIEGARKC